MTFWGWIIQSVFAFYFSFNFGSQSCNTVLLKTLLKTSINEFSIWLCSTDPNSPFPFSGFCSHWCTLCALKMCLFYALPIVFGADLGTKWKTVHTRPGRVRSESEWSRVQILPLRQFLTYENSPTATWHCVLAIPPTSMVPLWSRAGEAIKEFWSLHWIAMWLWGNSLIFLSLSFLSCKMEVVVPLSLGFSLRKMKRVGINRALSKILAQTLADVRSS